MNTRQFDDQANQPNESENKTKFSLFMSHLEQKNIDIERDLLLLEIATTMGLPKDLRFQYFMDHCKQHTNRQNLDVQPTLIAKYEKRLAIIADELVNEDWSDPEMQLLGSVVSMVQTLIVEGRLKEVDQSLRLGFPEYYGSTSEVNNNG